jgi:hypothetical protein
MLSTVPHAFMAQTYQVSIFWWMFSVNNINFQSEIFLHVFNCVRVLANLLFTGAIQFHHHKHNERANYKNSLRR